VAPPGHDLQSREGVFVGEVHACVRQGSGTAASA
jgi:hypothetical protein